MSHFPYSVEICESTAPPPAASATSLSGERAITARGVRVCVGGPARRGTRAEWRDPRVRVREGFWSRLGGREETARKRARRWDFASSASSSSLPSSSASPFPHLSFSDDLCNRTSYVLNSHASVSGARALST